MLRNPHVLIEMTDEPDCRSIGLWLIKAAEAQTFWSQALRDPDFENRVFALCAFCMPNLRICCAGNSCCIEAGAPRAGGCSPRDRDRRFQYRIRHAGAT